jgi:hypothetical protein
MTIFKISDNTNSMISSYFFWIFLLGYFFCCCGIFYDVVNEPPSIGKDANGRPKAFLIGNPNGQYVMEGIVASFFICLCPIGFIILDYAQKPMISRNNRLIAYIGSGVLILSSFFMTRMFMRIKVPNYLQELPV